MTGWKIVVGGTSGIRPRLAEVLAEDIATDDEALALVDKIVDYYKVYPKKVRLGRIIEEVGIDRFKSEIL
jgi:NAD(P)H-nitrite reductase large subunit